MSVISPEVVNEYLYSPAKYQFDANIWADVGAKVQEHMQQLSRKTVDEIMEDNKTNVDEDEDVDEDDNSNKDVMVSHTNQTSKLLLFF